MMRIEVQKWGNSAAVRVPAAVLKQAGIQVGQRLELRVEGDSLVLAPAAECLDDLLSGITPQNMHAVQWDDTAVGGEAW